MAKDLHAWLALTQEEPLEPGLPICDPHHHFWDRDDDRYAFRRYMLDELADDTGAGHNIVRTVFVECSSEYRQDGPSALRPVGETEFVERLADESARKRGRTVVSEGIVGFADLALGDGVAQVLEAHLEASHDRFRGIRHAAAWDDRAGLSSYKNPPKGLLMSDAFRKGFAHLQKYGLSFDAWVYHPQIGELSDLARAFPGVTIILDHIGGPLGVGAYASRRKEAFEDWRRGIAALSANQNVFVKLGGLGMPLTGFDWHAREKPIGSEELARAMEPYYLWCIEQFGPQRCMFESNFPVDKVSYSYGVMWNAFKRLTRGFSRGERAALLQNSAARAYRLGA